MHISFTLCLIIQSAINSSSCPRTITAISSYCQLSSSVSSLWAGKPDDQACWTLDTSGGKSIFYEVKQVLGFGAQVADQLLQHLMGFLQQLLGLWLGLGREDLPLSLLTRQRKCDYVYILPSGGRQKHADSCAFLPSHLPLLPGLLLVPGC